MIITQLIGGLGNQLFQYAAGRGIAQELETELKLDISGFRAYPLRSFKLNHFNITCQIASDDEILSVQKKGRSKILNKISEIVDQKKPFYKRNVIRERFSYQYDKEIELIHDNRYLEGYWQNEQYFKDIEELIRSEFTLKDPVSAPNQMLLQIVENDDNSVSIHIRRGDYVTNAHTSQYHGTCSPEYYYAAMKKIQRTIPSPHYYIFSDDISWVKENLSIPGPVTFFEGRGDRDYEELMLMKCCRYNIIANSSFSWWGAWLNDNPAKMVIAPLRWLNDPNINTSDAVPGTWIRI